MSRLLLILSSLILLNLPLHAQNMRNTPQEVAGAFMDYWNQGNIEGMYNLISLQSKQMYPYEVFENRYTVAIERINFEGIEYTLGETRIQGVTASVTYDATLTSATYDDIVDAGRIMRMVQEGENWRIAWSTMDILNGYAGDTNLQVDSRFPRRANIYDRNGLPLVEQGGTIMVIGVIQQDMQNVDACIDILAETMMRSRRTLARTFANYNPDTFFQIGEMDRDVYLTRQNELERACALNVARPPFNKVSQYNSRRYYGGPAVAHVAGYVGRVPGDQLGFWQARGYQAGDIVGRSAIEYTFDAQLAGRAERILRLIDPGGGVIRELGGALGASAVPVQLTIDRNLQYQTAKALNDAFNYAAPNWASVATGGAAVVLDVNTGAILAIASYPSFDPSLFNPNNNYANPGEQLQALNTDPRSPLSNKAVQEQYAPGSIYKIFTTAAAASEGVWDMNAFFDCQLTWEGQERFGDSLPFREDWRVYNEFPPAGEITMSQALAASCNPFFWEMGALLYQRSPSLLADYSENFGLGRRTGFGDIATEVAGNVARPNAMPQALNNAIGQGDVQITALQMARAVAAIANGGTMYRPYIVTQVGGFDNTDVQQTFSPTVDWQLNTTQEALDVIVDGMCSVTTDRNLGTAFRIFGNAPYSSCGKTGTAEAGSRGSGIPPHAWYVSFAPRENPQIAVVVVVTNSREGSEVGAPITRRILDHYFGANIQSFPDWWRNDYVPIEPPRGVEG